MSIPIEDEKLMTELKTDPAAMSLLKAKAQWEHVSLFGVLKDWGDPRKWHDGSVYREEQAYLEKQKAGAN